VASRYRRRGGASTSAGSVASGLALRVDVLPQIGAIESNVLAEFDERQAVFRVIAGVFVDPRDVTLRSLAASRTVNNSSPSRLSASSRCVWISL
jgi:hypothetical protein